MISLFFLLILQVAAAPRKPVLLFAGGASNDLYRVLEQEGLDLERFDSPAAAIGAARKGDAVFVVADGYPLVRTQISEELLRQAGKKKLGLYIEYPEALPGLNFPAQALKAQLERGVVTCTVFGPGLKPLSILAINDCYVLPVSAADPLLVLAQVVGLDKAEYGIGDVVKHPLLFKQGNMLVATTKVTNFLTRVQVQSEPYKDLDGAWFRAFEYDRWEYWTSNADVGWGAWGTLAGWTQSWIVTTQVLTAQNQNFWDLTRNSAVKKHMPRTLSLMVGKQKK